jgi:GT2 family glycosyltransferase
MVIPQDSRKPNEVAMQTPVVVSIVVVSWKVRELLRLCLTSIYAETRMSHDQFEIIVVDNDSRDGSVEMVREEFPDVVLIANADNVGFGAANNQAFSFCHGQYLLLLNPDTVVLDQAIDRVVAHIDTLPDVAALGCRLLNGDGSLQKWTGGAFPGLWNVACHYLFLDRMLPRAMRPRPLYLAGEAQGDLDVDWLCGAFLLLRRSALGQTIFNEQFFMYGEDMELCHRLKRSGHRVVYSPVASIIHYQGESMKQQRGEILLSSIKGPRLFFQMTRKNSPAVVLDLLTVTGFFLRWFFYSVASAAGRGERYAEKASSSRQYMGLAWRIMRSS